MYTLKVKGVTRRFQNSESFEDIFPYFISKTFVLVTFKSGYAAIVFKELSQAEKLGRFIRKYEVQGFSVCHIIDGFFEYDERERNPEFEFTVAEHTELDVTAVDPCLNEHLTCSICMNLFNKPYSSECGHIFCKSCVLNWAKTSKSCPVCRNPISRISRAIVIENILDDMQVFCIYDEFGCPWEGKKKELQKHLDSCPLEYIRCDLCNVQGRRLQFLDHTERCTGIILKSCDNLSKGCKFRGTKQEMKYHYTECDYEVVRCVKAGCKFARQRRHFQEHTCVTPQIGYIGVVKVL